MNDLKFTTAGDYVASTHMNERIRELMVQAVKFRLDPDSNAYEAQVSPEDMELFAELIVRECIDLCELWNTTPGAKLAKEIKQYFGVEL